MKRLQKLSWKSTERNKELIHPIIFTSIKKFLNHNISASAWKPNRPGDSMFAVNFCFLGPLTVRSGSGTRTGLQKMQSGSLFKSSSTLHYSAEIPIEDMAKTELLHVRSVTFFCISNTALFHKSIS